MTTILYDDRGLVVDVFEEILSKHENIACMISGGVDSSFTLYWLAKCIDELKLHDTHTILPMTAIEDLSVLAYCNIKEVREIIRIVHDYFPKVQILDHYAYDAPTTETKTETNDRHRKMLLDSGLVDHILSSCVAGPLFENVYLGWQINDIRSIENQRKKGDNYKYNSPFGLVDKKFIAYQYKKYNLLNTIFPLTRSCVDPYPDGKACKKCPWCLEKYWAYNMYDNCIEFPKPKFRKIPKHKIKKSTNINNTNRK